jgi:hypothetical protein
MKVATSAIRRDGRIDAGLIALLAALVIFPLYPKVGLIAIQGTYIPVRLDDFVTAAVLGCWAITLIRARRWPRVPPIAPAVLVWLAIGLVSVGIGAGILGTIGWGTGALFWAKPIEYLALGWVAYDLVDSPARLRLFLVAVFTAAAIVVVYALLERFGWAPRAPNYGNDVTLRRVLGSTMGDSHQLATYLGSVILLGIVLWHRLEPRFRVVGIVALALSAYVLVHAAGRSEYISLAACTALLAIWRPARTPALAAIAILAVLFVLPPAVDASLTDVLGRRVEPVIASPAPGGGPGQTAAPGASPPPAINVAERFEGLEADRSLQIRMERWPVFIALAMRDPLFGAGPSAATEAADGYYVRSFTEVGIVGTLAFAAVIASVVFALRRVARGMSDVSQAASIGLIAATLFIALVGVLIDTWVASRVMQLYWPAVGAVLATIGSVAGVATVARAGTVAGAATARPAAADER